MVVFKDVDFGKNGADSLTARFLNGDDANCDIAIMIDDPNSAPIATMSIGKTGEWDPATGFGFYSLPVAIEGGIHTVYFKFVNDQSGSLYSVYFYEAEPAPEPEPTTSSKKLPFLCALDITVGEGGSANASGNLLIARYATRTLRFTADEGYEIADVLVNGKSVGAVSKYKVGPATRDIHVEVRFAPIAVDEPATEDAAVEVAE